MINSLPKQKYEGDNSCKYTQEISDNYNLQNQIYL